MSAEYPELLPRPELRLRQLTRLNDLLTTVCERNLFWKERLRELNGATVLKSLDDLSRFPFLYKEDLVANQAAHPPFGTNLTYPVSQFSRLHQTSGTTGLPLRWLDTSESWNWFLDCWQQIYRLVGIRPDDIFAFPFSFGPFIGFWAAFEGAQRRGNLSLTLGGMGSEARLNMILELGATVICCTPTYALRLADVAAKEGLPLAESAVRLLIVAGEPGASVPAVRERIESAWGARLIDHWGMTDVGSLAVQPVDSPNELVILESECIAEILEAGGDQPVPPGDLGELVITNLGRWGQPVIRYRTGDLVRARVPAASESLQLLRLDGGILGRVDDMITIRGNNVFPSSLDAVLREFPEIAEYRTTVMTRRSMPHLKIEIEPAGGLAGNDALESAGVLVGIVERTIRDRLNFHAEVIAVEGLPRFEHKGRRFFREDQ
jgi:phenylacetate-CoA ligase